MDKLLMTPDPQNLILEPADSTALAAIRKIEFQAKRAEDQAKQAETQAGTAETHARIADLEIKGLSHKANVQAKFADEYAKKAATASEAWAKYHAFAASVTDKKQRATTLSNEAQAKAEPHEKIASNERAAAKAAKIEANTPGRSKNEVKAAAQKRASAKSKAREAEAKIIPIKAEANKADEEVRKSQSEAKKAKLIAEEASAAISLQAKHAAIASQAEATIKVKQEEAEARRAEARARRGQAKAKYAEAKALRAGNVTEAKAQNQKARVQKAEAITIGSEIKEKKTKAKPNRNNVENKSQPPMHQPLRRQARLSAKKHLSAPGLLDRIYKCFSEVSDLNRGKQGTGSGISLSDCLMGGLALFSLKYPSLLQFDQDSREGGCIQNNLKSLYKVEKAPSDTYMRKRLDVVDPLSLRPVFKELFAQVQRGKILEEYTFLDNYFLMSGDGSGHFSSKTVHCENCCVKHHKDSSITYYHQMMSAAIVHPDIATVIPFCPEAIINMVDSTKNDCERNASERLYKHIRREHPHLSLIVTEDAIGSNGPHIKLLNEVDMRFILVVKPDGNKSLFEFLNGAELEEYTHTDGEYTYIIKFINKIPLNDSHHDLMVNFLQASVYINGELDYHNTWITDIPITKSNVFRLYQGGRAKWKIENETFNTLKNQGYSFEHNFGHGKKYLSTVLAFLMYLAFFVDQIQEACCGLFQEALMEMKSRTRLWVRMRAYFLTLYIDSWESLWQGIAFGIERGRLIPLKPSQDTS